MTRCMSLETGKGKEDLTLFSNLDGSPGKQQPGDACLFTAEQD